MYQKYVAIGMLGSMLSSPYAFASPASTEYVKASIDAVRTDFSSQINSINTNILATQNQIADITGNMNQLRVKTNELNTTLNELIMRLNSLTTKVSDSDSNTTNKIEIVQKQINELPLVTHQIGEIYQGGMIFYVDSTQQHGLIASLADLGDPIEWRNGEGGDRITNAKSHGLGAGEANTRLIISEQTIDEQGGNFAALVANNYQIGADGKSPCPTTMSATLTCYGGWYLPSDYELVLLHSSLKQMGLAGLKDELYWSSTEGDTTQAWLLDFYTGESKVQDKSTQAQIRAIRHF
ncbi:coiled-coil domain-containing protein [Legionella drancourtii]|uniref:Legionella vir region protein n=1 Tax=Legionella drancourtii LLAP12 TaxID=658187 RepID=G9EQA4_9GAMM|nr:DUF1566 domain-containing protein [Legionella drancourtii]EHL30499.1 hypothetical protein LDG_7451 [Legionella drancourtii LLAP12]